MADKSKNSDKKMSQLDLDSLEMHRTGKPGKIEINATKPLTTQRDLSLAYSPGVAAPCVEIHADPNKAYDYTARGNLVAVVSNGTAVLGLGNIGALASKPVMEGKSVLFKRFADIDAHGSGGRQRGCRRSGELRALPWPDFRRHQSGRYQGAGMLHHRATPARTHGHPDLSMMTSTERRSSAGRHDQRPASDRARHQGHQDRCERRRRGIDRLYRTDESHGATPRSGDPVR